MWDIKLSIRLDQYTSYIPFVVKFFVMSIISNAEIIEKKFRLIELSKNRVKSCRFL